ncbi:MULTISPECIES: MFS transporter [unclassified Leifsonia]|uniref:MFS transporter n=1 Tax=unclassified Leifsonia TaxID=2663824 RepID=UPI0006FA22F5|nr:MULTISPECIES: MFS transporter [unclassified Leifsonia]KQX08255.1 MFS transporter [Leifsonia sp. Root1293]KRA12537.1 MFS transporter [Leifsonia sp. Root60]
MTAAPITQNIPLTPQKRWRAYWVCVAVAALTILDLSKVNVALPSIEKSFGASSTELQLIVSGYVLAFGLTLVPAGRFGDIRSRKTFFIVGLTLFTLASIGCALAPTSTFLLVARLVQGVAAGIQMPQVLGLIQQLFQGAERGKAFGLFGAMIGIATAVGPTLGGLLIAIGGESDGWRLIFWINLPLGVAALALAIWLLPQTRERSSRSVSVDPIGILLFGIAVLALMWPFLLTTGAPTDNPSRWWMLVVFVLGVTAFIAWETRYAAHGRDPLIPLTLFRISSFRNGSALIGVYFAALPSAFLLTTLYLQQGLGLAPVFAGMVSIGFALTSAFSSWRGGILVARYGRTLVVWGLVGVLLGAGLLVAAAILTPPELTPWFMAGAMLVAGTGGGFVVSPNQTLTLHDIPVRQGGLAGSVGQLGQRIGTAIGTAIALSLFYSTIYREKGSGESDITLYHHAYGYGMLSVALFIAVAFAIAVLDLGSRRRRGSKPADDAA